MYTRVNCTVAVTDMQAVELGNNQGMLQAFNPLTATRGTNY